MAELDPLLSDEGWPYASTPPVEEGDPGRFHALFGRDSLICSLQLLPERPRRRRGDAAGAGGPPGPPRPSRARSRSRARSGTSSATGAPRAVRRRLGWPDDGAFAYYGTADATSWFLVVMAALAARLADELEASWRAAAGWLDRALERGGGLVRHAPGAWPALTQQGWRDTVDPTASYGGGILRPDGTVPDAAARRRRLAGRGLRGAERAGRARSATAAGRTRRARCARGCRPRSRPT